MNDTTSHLQYPPHCHFTYQSLLYQPQSTIHIPSAIDLSVIFWRTHLARSIPNNNVLNKFTSELIANGFWTTFEGLCYVAFSTHLAKLLFLRGGLPEILFLSFNNSNNPPPYQQTIK